MAVIKTGMKRKQGMSNGPTRTLRGSGGGMPIRRGVGGGGMPGGVSGWVWVPAGASLPSRVPMMGKGGAKGSGKGKVDKTMERIRGFAAEKKVWVGGLTKQTTWKKLEKHFKEVNPDLKPVLGSVNERKGTGIVCFKNEDDMNTAVAELNGTELDGNTIEVDVWTKPEKPPKEEGDDDEEKKEKRKRNKKKGATQNTLKAKTVSKIAEKLKAIDPELKLWVGGLPENTTFKELSKHFEDQFSKPHIVDIMGRGRACVSYETADEVASAVAIVNGSEFNDKTIEVDNWKKPEKKEKVKKEKED